MSYNGSGTFNINTAGQPVVTGTTITSTAFNLLTADLATGLSTALTKDGQTTPTANIPLGGFKITGLGAGTAATDAAQYGQLQAGATTIATVTGTDTYVGTLTPAIAAYATGNLFSFVAPNTNTGASTINLNSLGAKNITKQGSTALIAGDIASGRVHIIEYDGTRFQLINPASSTGTGAAVFATSPTLVTPALGTPSSLVLTNATGLPNAGLVNSSITIGGTAIALGASSNTLANDITIYGVTVGRGAGAISTNTAVGASALAANTGGGANNSTALGYNALLVATGGSNLAVGSSALAANTTGDDNTAIGSYATLVANTTGTKNVAVGRQALAANTTASNNTAVGYQAAYSNTTGSTITAVGRQALYTNSTGANNVAVGNSALYANTTGTNNISVGDYANGQNTTGSYNVAIGRSALDANTTASYNTSVGYQSGYSNTTGSSLTFLGYYAGRGSTGDGNTAIGSEAYNSASTGGQNTIMGNVAGAVISSGSYNTAIGSAALRFNTTTSYNTAIGYQAGYSNTTGTLVAVGALALNSATTGADNVAVGTNALQATTTGSYNIAIGRQALVSNTTASNSVALGYQAGYSNSTGGSMVAIGQGAAYTSTGAGNVCVGTVAGYGLTTGTYNTFIGSNGSTGGCGYYVTTGSKNTILGGYNGNQGSLDIRTASNNIVLSDGDGNPRGVFDSSGNFYIGKVAGDIATSGVQFESNGTAGFTRASSTVVQVNRKTSTGSLIDFYYNTGIKGSISTDGTTTSYNITSDQRLKENIQDADSASSLIDSLHVRKFDWKNSNLHQRYGFIAQELVTVAPEAVYQPEDTEQMMSVDYSKLVPMLVKEIQSLRKRLADAGIA